MPQRKSFGGKKSWKEKGYRLYEEVMTEDNEPRMKKIVDFKLEKGEKNRRVVVLDKDLDYAIRMHRGFKHDGTWSNMVVCRSALDDHRGCPLCEVLERRFSWFLVGTVIDLDGFTPKEGKNAGVKYPNLRRLLLIPDQVAETFETIGSEIEGGWRGSQFKVSRSSGDKSLRIGDNWREDFRAGKIGEQEMLDEFEESAERYGLSVEKFSEPFDYDTILAPKSYEELLEIAKEISKGSSVNANTPARLSESGGSNDEEALPF